MAIAAGTVFEFRATATAGMVNGGGFNPNNASPGIDYSQQDAAQYNATDLASANATTNPPQITSASHTFDSNDHGNFIHITAGTNWTAGWYEIVSTSGGAATLDRACGSAASVSGGTYYVGGALSLNSTLDDEFFDTPGFTNGGIILWFKKGAYTTGEAIVTPAGASGAATAYNFWLGYNTTRGDVCEGTNRPVINVGNVTNSINFTSSNYWFFGNCSFIGTGTGLVAVGPYKTIYNCLFYNSSSSAGRPAASANSTYSWWIKCEFISIRGYAASVVNYTTNFENCLFQNSASGLRLSSLGDVDNCIFLGNLIGWDGGTTAFTAPLKIWNSTFYGAQSKRGTGIFNTTNATLPKIYNCDFYGLSKGIDQTTLLSIPSILSGKSGFEDHNNFYNNTTNVTNVIQGNNDTALDSGYSTNIIERTGSTATTSGSTITQTGATFSTWGLQNATNGVPKHFLYLKSGTGVTVGIYGIISVDSETQLTLDNAPGTNATTDKTWSIVQVTGNGFRPGLNLKGIGNGYNMDGFSNSYVDIGAVQRQEAYPVVGDVKNGVSYAGGDYTGTGANITSGSQHAIIGSGVGNNKLIGG
jgi:hypothetical protein